MGQKIGKSEHTLIMMSYSLSLSLCLFSASGGNVTLGVDTLLEDGVDEQNIYILTLFCTPKGNASYELKRGFAQIDENFVQTVVIVIFNYSLLFLLWFGCFGLSTVDLPFLKSRIMILFT